LESGSEVFALFLLLVAAVRVVDFDRRCRTEDEAVLLSAERGLGGIAML